MKNLNFITLSTCLFLILTINNKVLAEQTAKELQASVSATYNTKHKTITPTITLSRQFNNFNISGWVNIKDTKVNIISSGLNVKAGETYVEPAAYTVQDAYNRFGIPLPTGGQLPGNANSPYSWDGTRIDGQPISGVVDGIPIVANKTLVTADQNINRPAVTETNGGTEYGLDIKTDLVNDGINKLLALGIGVKYNGKNMTPYISALGEYKLTESIKFFADAKVPFDNNGVDVSSGVKILF
jgi:hypothetical protein